MGIRARVIKSRIDDRWFYVIEWRQTNAGGDGLEIPVLMSGVAVPLKPDAP
jgi:hypothetical protein